MLLIKGRVDCEFAPTTPCVGASDPFARRARHHDAAVARRPGPRATRCRTQSAFAPRARFGTVRDASAVDAIGLASCSRLAHRVASCTTRIPRIGAVANERSRAGEFAWGMSLALNSVGSYCATSNFGAPRLP